jgi:hypothetical protein
MKTTDFYINNIDKRTGQVRSTKYYPNRVKCDVCPAKNTSVLLVRVCGSRRHLCAACRAALGMLHNSTSQSEIAS